MGAKPIGFIITEDMHVPEKTELVKEENGHVVAEACLQEAEEENRNGRVYLTEDLTREQTCKRTIELLTTGYMRGEAGHPTETSIIRQQTIDPTKVCVRYSKFWMDGPKWMAHYTGTNNDLGEAIDKDLRCGFRPAFSMRSLGTLENINGRNVVRDLRYITHDMVIYPSHPGAYTTGLVQESAIGSTKHKSYFNEQFSKMKEQTKTGIVIPIMNEQVIDYIKQESANINSILEQFEIFYESVAYDPKHNRVTIHSKNNDIFVVNLETYIKNEIEQYCDSI